MALAVTSSAPAGAETLPFELAMVDGGGRLHIRDAATDVDLEAPTTLTGSINGGEGATGVVSGLSLATPPISFQQPVAGGALTADIKATFSELQPGTGTGQVDPAGNVVVRSALKVALDIKVASVGIQGDCSSSPVNLELASTAPYDLATQRVTLSDPDFSVPAFVATSTCPALLVGPLNEALAGSGHSISMTMQGAVVPPPVPGDPSTTTLAVAPAGQTSIGQPVVFTATVAPGVGATRTEVPTGTVEFRDGSTVLGQVTLVDGTAELSTSALRFGTRTLTARYRGDSAYQGSTSPAQTLSVLATPTITTQLPDTVKLGGSPEAFDLEVSNPSAGQAIDNLRVDVSLRRTGRQTYEPFSASRILLEQLDAEGTWVPVALTDVADPQEAKTVVGSLAPDTGRSLAAGADLTTSLRLSFPGQPTGPLPGEVTVSFDAVRVDPVTGAKQALLSTTSGRLDLVNQDRLPTYVEFYDAFAPPISPNVVRQQGTITVPALVLGGGSGSFAPHGPVALLVDGQPVKAWAPHLPGGLAAEPQYQIPGASLFSVYIDLPGTVGPGVHTLTARFLGDVDFLPSSFSSTFTVVEPIGTSYDCQMPFSIEDSRRFTVQVDGRARLPRSKVAGSTVPLADFELDVVAGRSLRAVGSFQEVLTGFDALTLDIGPGSGGASSVTLEGSVQEDPADTEPDAHLTLDGLFGSVPVTGAPGEVIDATLDGFTLTGAGSAGGGLELSCVAAGDPLDLGSITVAGTTLSVASPTPTRAGDDIGLTATVAPGDATGTVEFYDGSTLLDISPVVAATATATVTLPVGTHSLTARFKAGASAPSSTSAAVPLTVLAAIECPSQAVAGDGAVVRQVYLELLGRCADPAGYSYWTGKLGSGTSAGTFARSFATSSELSGRLVDEAYQTVLGRTPDPTGRAHWTRKLLGAGRYDALLAELAASNEFWTAAGRTPAGFVDRYYARVLGHPADATGRSYWMAKLGSGAPRQSVAAGIARGGELQGKLVDAAYLRLLGRAPTAPERSSGVAGLLANGNRLALYGTVIGTAEFRARAQTFPNPA